MERMEAVRIVLVAAVAFALSACAGKPAVITVEKPVITHVEVPAPCPTAEERERLRTLRPVALRNQPMPTTVGERTAKALAQLGKYEAEGGYADQVDAALDRCQRH